jgi:hypothetical protein
MCNTFLSRLRALLFKRPTFTYCAACGELPTPPGNRLCVSLKPNWPVDAVLTGAWDARSADETAASLRITMPWLGRVFMPPSAQQHPDMKDSGILAVGTDETNLHLTENLAEYFITLPWETRRTFRQPLLREDFFTPNGLPLLFAEPGGTAKEPLFITGPAGRTKKLTALFAAAGAAEPSRTPRNEAEYALAFARWAYAGRHAILALNPFAE